MIEISLTDFVDFVISSGTPKLTRVKQVKERPDYHPAYDFWKPLRESIVSFHCNGTGNKNELDDIPIEVSDKKKVNRYTDCIIGYKRFLGRKKVEWFSPPWAKWEPEGLEIRVNPELGLSINGEPHVIKLYFKADRLSKRRIDTILQLMRTALSSQVEAGTKFAVLDVASAKLYVATDTDENLLPLLVGEAASFVAMWNMLE